MEEIVENKEDYYLIYYMSNRGKVLDICSRNGNLFYCIGSDEPSSEDEMEIVAGPFTINEIKSKLLGETNAQ